MMYQMIFFSKKSSVIDNDTNLETSSNISEKNFTLDDKSLTKKHCLFKVTNRNTRERSKTFSKSTLKTPEQRHRLRRGVFNVN